MSAKELKKRGFKFFKLLVFFSFVCEQTRTPTRPIVMMSSSANDRPFLSSFRHIPPQESLVQLANFNYPDKKWPPGRKAYFVKLGFKSFVDGRQDICKDKKSNLGSVVGY